MPKTIGNLGGMTERELPTSLDARDLLTATQVEQLTGGALKAGTLGYWRNRGRDEGPRWFRVGPRRVYYLRADVLDYLAAGERVPHKGEGR